MRKLEPRRLPGVAGRLGWLRYASDTNINRIYKQSRSDRSIAPAMVRLLAGMSIAPSCTRFHEPHLCFVSRSGVAVRPIAIHLDQVDRQSPSVRPPL